MLKQLGFLGLQLCLFSRLILAQEITAANSITLPLNLKGEEVSTTITDPNIKYIVYESISRGNMSHAVNIYVEGVDGISATLKTAQRRKDGSTGRFVDLTFRGKRGRTIKALQDKPDAQAASIRAQDAGSGEPTPEQIERLKKATGFSESVIRLLLSYMSEEELLAKYGKNGSKPAPTPTPTSGQPNGSYTPGTLSGTTMLHKDYCKGGVDQYLIQTVVDLTKINPDRYTVGFTITTEMSISGGERAASSIKPVSDGKFAPRPLLLMESASGNYYGAGEYINMVIWKGGAPKQIKQVKVSDYVYYKGFALARAVADGILGGGSATFEITNYGNNTYGSPQVGVACLRRQRVRQRVNGYP